MKHYTAVPFLNHKVRSVSATPMRDMFAHDKERFRRFSCKAGTLLLDYSKNRIDKDTLSHLISIVIEARLPERRAAMFSGEAINQTEDRAVLHTALRSPRGHTQASVGDEIHAVLDQMQDFSEAVRLGKCLGFSKKKFRDVVNIGIGGSDLGPAMVTKALTPYHDGPNVHFVSNVDSAHLIDTLRCLNPQTTLFLVVSKTFTTQETMRNAHSARAWIVDQLAEQAVAEHFAAISTNHAAIAEFGLKEDRVFGFWDFVGGRYSVWSAVGLSVMLAIGYQNFYAFLAGAFEMDEHFQNAPLAQNLPVILAVLGVWYRNFLGYQSHAVLPYDQRLARFPAYLQQLDMESNGKGVRLDGSAVEGESGGIIWGEPGTNGQHSFYQLIHQGTSIIPCDFLLAARPQEQLADHHTILAAHCFAQSEALMRGKTLVEVEAEMKRQGLDEAEIARLAPHKVFSGNRPSNTLLYDQLDPQTLGSLMALYEHKVFVQGVIWGINSFDQWGVELGKQLADTLFPMLSGTREVRDKDCSTEALIDAYRARQRS